jgi:hypothetical protein
MWPKIAGAFGREYDSGSKQGKTAAVKMLCGGCGWVLAMLIAVLML